MKKSNWRPCQPQFIHPFCLQVRSSRGIHPTNFERRAERMPAAPAERVFTFRCLVTHSMHSVSTRSSDVSRVSQQRQVREFTNHHASHTQVTILSQGFGIGVLRRLGIHDARRPGVQNHLPMVLYGFYIVNMGGRYRKNPIWGLMGFLAFTSKMFSLSSFANLVEMYMTPNTN